MYPENRWNGKIEDIAAYQVSQFVKDVMISAMHDGALPRTLQELAQGGCSLIYTRAKHQFNTHVQASADTNRDRKEVK